MLEILKQNVENRAKISLSILFVITFSIFFFFLYLDLKSSIAEMKEDINTKFDSIESSIYLDISDAKHIIYTLSALFSQELVAHDNSYIHKVMKSFAYGFKSDSAESLLGLMVLNNDGIVLSSTEVPEFQSESKGETTFKCATEACSNYFTLQVSDIRFSQGHQTQELILPLSMRFSNAHHKSLGIICGGLKILNLEERLSILYDNNKYFSSIKLKQYAHYDINEMTNQFEILAILKNYLYEDNLILHRVLKNYPIVIEAKVEYRYLKKLFRVNLLLCTGFFFVFIIFSCLSWFLTREIFQDHLFAVHKKLYALNNWLKKQPITQILSPELLATEKFSPSQLAKDINDLINRYYALQEELLKLPELEIKKKVLNLVLTEQHFLSQDRSSITSIEKLYLNKLMTIIDEKPITLPIAEFLTQVVNYCSEFYHELNIKVEISKKDRKNFSFKHAALLEAIFQIFTFICRSSFDCDGHELVLKANFIDKSDFPTIIIEAEMPGSDTEALGWSFGPSYTYTSLLPIYLLAKENKLFFDIVKKDNKILFILNPIDKKINFYNRAFDSFIPVVRT